MRCGVTKLIPPNLMHQLIENLKEACNHDTNSSEDKNCEYSSCWRFVRGHWTVVTSSFGSCVLTSSLQRRKDNTLAICRKRTAISSLEIMSMQLTNLPLKFIHSSAEFINFNQMSISLSWLKSLNIGKLYYYLSQKRKNL